MATFFSFAQKIRFVFLEYGFHFMLNQIFFAIGECIQRIFRDNDIKSEFMIE